MILGMYVKTNIIKNLMITLHSSLKLVVNVARTCGCKLPETVPCDLLFINKVFIPRSEHFGAPVQIARNDMLATAAAANKIIASTLLRKTTNVVDNR